MDQGVHSFRLATAEQRGTVVLSQEGLDIVRCLLIRWIEQAAKGEEAAVEMGGNRKDSPQHGQALYFRYAKSYLLQKLCSGLSDKMNIREELRLLTQWHDGHELPSKWRQTLEQVTASGIPDELSGASVILSGEHRPRGDRPVEVVPVNPGECGPPSPYRDSPEEDSGPVGEPYEADAVGTGAARTAGDRGQGEQREPQGEPTGCTPKTPKGRRGGKATGKGKGKRGDVQLHGGGDGA